MVVEEKEQWLPPLDVVALLNRPAALWKLAGCQTKECYHNRTPGEVLGTNGRAVHPHITVLYRSSEEKDGGTTQDRPYPTELNSTILLLTTSTGTILARIRTVCATLHYLN